MVIAYVKQLDQPRDQPRDYQRTRSGSRICREIKRSENNLNQDMFVYNPDRDSRTKHEIQNELHLVDELG
jgi:hypothetical protein